MNEVLCSITYTLNNCSYRCNPSFPDCQKYDDLPLELKYSGERQIQKKKIILDVLLKLKLHKYTTMFSSFDTLDDFREMALVVPASETSRLILGKTPKLTSNPQDTSKYKLPE